MKLPVLRPVAKSWSCLTGCTARRGARYIYIYEREREREREMRSLPYEFGFSASLSSNPTAAFP